MKKTFLRSCAIMAFLTSVLLTTVCGESDASALDESAAPELAVSDPEDPQATAHDATVKCVYTDDSFYALIVSATDPEHGLKAEDGYDLTDHDGQPYDALPEGKYTLQVKLSSADGRELASASEEIEIGRKTGTIVHEMTTGTIIQKGGKDLVYAWAAEEQLTMLDDLLPGFFGTEYQMATMPMAVVCEDAEYLNGEIRMLVYGNMAISASYCLEVARYLQLEHNTENPDIVKYYLFSLGEPRFAGEQAEITPFGDSENMRVCRIDRVKDETKDGVFLTTEEQVLASDTDPSDGWMAGEGAFAVAGVMKPYQLRDDELVPDKDIYGLYRFLNGADTLVFRFTPDDGSETFSVTKTIGVSRIDAPDEEADPALYEFYSVFPGDTLKEGTAYDLDIQAYDREGNAIEGMSCRLKLNCRQEQDK